MHCTKYIRTYLGEVKTEENVKDSNITRYYCKQSFYKMKSKTNTGLMKYVGQNRDITPDMMPWILAELSDGEENNATIQQVTFSFLC
jgi:hypothetical protein